MSDMVNSEPTMHPDCPPPRPECGCENVPVIVERIKKQYLNPDGSLSHRYYYQYPVTNFRAVHVGDSIHSPNLDDVVGRLKVDIAAKQPMLKNGSKDSILTRSMQDGVFGELEKVDYVNPDRKSKTAVPSEHAVLTALDTQATNYAGLVENEKIRALAEEQKLLASVQDEKARAMAVEGELESALTGLDEKFISQSVVGESGSVLKNLEIDTTDLHHASLSLTRLSLKTGDTDQTMQCLDLMTPNEKMVDEKLETFRGTLNFVDPKIFDNVEDSLVVDSQFKIGEGDTIGRLAVTKKNVNGAEADITKFVSFKSDMLEKTVNDISDTENEINLKVKTANSVEFLDAVRELFA